MIRIGTAGWNVPRVLAAAFPDEGSHLERYAQVVRCVEIDSSFYRPHRRTTYARWAGATPDDFRFAVKLPRTITHDARLVNAHDPLSAFLEQVAGLESKLGVLLVQLPPSLPFVAGDCIAFFELLHRLHAGPAVCEPRHASWFTDEADRVLVALRVGRVAADPASCERAAVPGGWLGSDRDGRGATIYDRWHGSPKMYWSAYCGQWLAAKAQAFGRWTDADRWCIFDNTAAGAALANARSLMALVAHRA